MAVVITGANLLTILTQKVNAPLSGNLTVSKANAIYQEALFDVFDRRYEELQGTKYYDELKVYIKTWQTFTPSAVLNNDGTYSNMLYLTPNTNPNIPDYLHLLAARPQFTMELPLTITNATNGNPIVITIKEQNAIRTSDYQVTYTEQYAISGITGNTNANGTFYVKKINTQQFQLYSDQYLQTPVVGNGIFGINSRPVLSKIYSRLATDYISIEKGAKLAYPSLEYPSYSITSNALKFYPNFLPCQSVIIDYVSNSLQIIDTNDNTIDLTAFYTPKFLYYLTDAAALIYSQQVRDGQLESNENFMLKANP